jgi:carboxy-terminal domain RNA polymerase II polypeptide A small phosphatase
MLRKLLILDLDETLIYATEKPLDRSEDFMALSYFVYERPHLRAFIGSMLELFDIAVWTSSGRIYASHIVARIFPSDSLEFLWASDRCTMVRDWETDQYISRKHLFKVKRQGWDLRQVIAVDDSPEKYARSYGNLVRVSEYLGDPNDRELPRLADYLAELNKEPNVRAIEKRFWRTSILKATEKHGN